MLCRQPGFALLAVGTLALGIGASVAVFSVVHGILLKPLAYPEPERIVLSWRVWPIADEFGNDRLPWGPLEYPILARSMKSFLAIGAFKPASLNLTGRGEPQRLDGVRVSAGFFPALGIGPELGRVFGEAEDAPGAEKVAVLGHALWSDRFGADPSVLGRPVLLDGEPYTVVGVMPAGFSFPRGEEMPEIMAFPPRPQIWIPLALPPSQRGPSELAVVGRLAPGASLASTQAELDVFAARLDREIPQGKGWWGSRAATLPVQVVDDVRRPLWLMFGAVSLVLLIASANVAGLILTRSLVRRRELTLRRALGASRRRIVGRFLIDSVGLGLLGGAAGILIARASLAVLRVAGPANVPRLREVVLDPPVLLFALLVTAACGLLAGLVPALTSVGPGLSDSLKDGGERSVGHGSGRRVHDGILIAEVALALVLVIGTGLLARTLARMLTAERGFDASRVLTFQISLPPTRYPDPAAQARAYDRALEALRTLPGVQAAGLTSAVPMGGAPDGSMLRVPGRPPSSDQGRLYSNYSFASPGYFTAIRARIVRGREFQSTDLATSAPVTVINEAMARKFWPGEDPIGRQVGVADTRWPLRTIVGVVADVKHYSLRETPAPEMFVPYVQNEIRIWPPMQTLQAALRTSSRPEALAADVRRALAKVDPDLPIAHVATLEGLVEGSTAAARFSVWLLAAFGGVALALATIGMYGVISYSVVQRTPEIGVRIALGAHQRQVFGMVVGQGARLAGTGVAIGLAVAAGCTRWVGRFLYGVRPLDPLTFTAVSLLLMGVAVLACWIPARKAMKVDPLIAMRRS